MKTGAASSGGSRSRRSRSLASPDFGAADACGVVLTQCQGLARGVGAAPAVPGEHELDRLSDLVRIWSPSFVGDLHAVAVLQLLDQRVQIQGVGFEIFAEPC